MDSSALKIEWDKYFNEIEKASAINMVGKIVRVVGLIAEGEGLGMGVGNLCFIKNEFKDKIMAEVVGFKNDRVLLMPYGDTKGISPGSKIFPIGNRPKVQVGEEFLGRVVDGMGKPIDNKGYIKSDIYYPLYGNYINPMDRKPIKEFVDVGISSINTMIPLGRGQRVAIMAGSGVGKSVLMGMITKHTTADVVVIGLIGERGREVKDFVTETLGTEGLKKSVVVAATSDMSPLIRMRGAYLATTIAEYFRDQGQNVLLLMDSITRFAMSSRDIGLAAGEPPTNRGYTPSFFLQIPKLLERAGYVQNKGSITGLYTVLVEGDDMNDPVGDTVRSITDGHIVLSRELANMGHYPAIDVLASVSRVINDVSSEKHIRLREKTIEILATYKKVEDMIAIGAYTDGSDPKIDEAKKFVPKINTFLKQGITEKVFFNDALQELEKIYTGAEKKKQ